MSDTSIKILVEYSGFDTHGKWYMEGACMEAEPEESLVSIVDRIDTHLLDVRVSSIRVRYDDKTPADEICEMLGIDADDRNPDGSSDLPYGMNV
jgi:hypothetical protein